MKCPNCDGDLDINEEEGLDFIFCRYCGHKCAIDYGTMRKQINYSKKLKSDENKLDKELKLKEKQLKLEKKLAKEKSDNRTYVIMFSLIAIVCIGMYVALAVAIVSDNKREEKLVAEGKIEVEASNEYVGRYYEDVNMMFTSLGFSNVECKELDEKRGFFKDPGEVKEVVIGGKTTWPSDSFFSKDTSVYIYYYK